MPRRLPILLAALALAGCGGSSSSDEPKPQAARPKPVDGCERVDRLERAPQSRLKKPTLHLDPAKTYVATVQTTCGTFTIRLGVRESPKTTASFVSLVRKGFYDGLTFQRVSPGFVIQGGDPRGDGLGGPGYTVVEPPPRSTHYTRGVVAMARSQSDPPGTSGSQFFVTLGEDLTVSSGLTPDYAVLGKVASGADVVQRIGSVPSNPQTEMPDSPIVISRITVAER